MAVEAVAPTVTSEVVVRPEGKKPAVAAAASVEQSGTKSVKV